MKKTISLLLSFLMVFSVCATTHFSELSVNALESVDNVLYAQMIAELRTTFKDGEYWNAVNECGYEGTGTLKCPDCNLDSVCRDVNCGCNNCGQFYYEGADIAAQCFGWACKMGNLIFGGQPNFRDSHWSQHYNAEDIRPGDILYGNVSNIVSGGSWHALFIVDISDDGTVTFADCNYTGPCQVRWDEQTTMEAVRYAVYTLGAHIHHASNNSTTLNATSYFVPIPYTDLPESTYYLKNKANGEYLSVSGAIDASRQNVNTCTRAESTEFQMKLTKATKGYEMRPLCCDSRVINSDGDTVTSGNNVNIYDDVNDSSQWWGFQETEGGYIIRNMRNPSCVLTLSDNSNVIVQRYQEGSDAQIWILEDIDAANKIDFDVSYVPDVKIYNTVLNDGNASGIDTIFDKGEWLGIERGVDTGDDMYAEIILDLGGIYDISKINIHFANEIGAGISNPWSVTLAVSDSKDGYYAVYDRNFDVVYGPDSVTDETAEQKDHVTYWSTLDNIEGMKGRYVKVFFWVCAAWVFMNEIEVYGEKTDVSTSALAYISGAASGTVINAELVNTALDVMFPYSPVVNLVQWGVSKLYDLTLTKAGEIIQPDVNVTVSVKAPDGIDVTKTKVWHIAEDGTITDMNAVYKDGYFVFDTDHFSYYLVGELAVLRGDVDNDSEIGAEDYILLKRVHFGTAKTENFDSATTADYRCDVDGNGKIDANDYIYLKRAYFGMYKIGL